VPDSLGDGIAVFQDIAVPKTENVETQFFQISISAQIIFALGMLRAIGFNNQSILKIHEIDDVAGDDDLSPEFEASQPFRP
jgi:hypothetical protein